MLAQTSQATRQGDHDRRPGDREKVELEPPASTKLAVLRLGLLGRRAVTGSADAGCCTSTCRSARSSSPAARLLPAAAFRLACLMPEFVRAVDYTLTAARTGAADPGASRFSSASSGGKLAPLFWPGAADPAPRC